MTETRTDESLLPAVARGDEAAIALLLERYWTRAYTLAYRLAGDPAAAEDVAQETFIKVLEHAGRFDASRRFRPWFFQILTNQARKQHRSASRRVDHEARAAVPPRVAPAPDGADAEAVHACLATLPDAQREPIALHYLDGLTYQEIADALSWPLGTVTSRVRRGLETLQTRLQPTHCLGPAVILELLREAPALQVPGAPAPLEVLAATQGALPPHVAPAPSPTALLAAARPRGSLALLAALALLPLTGLVGAALLGGDEEPGLAAVAPAGAAPGGVGKQPGPAPAPARPEPTRRGEEPGEQSGGGPSRRARTRTRAPCQASRSRLARAGWWSGS